MLPTSLDTIPDDVLQYIALLTLSSSIFDPPVDTLHLLLTSRTMYRSLSVAACPSLYAKGLQVRFDFYPSSGQDRPTTSALAEQFTNCCRLLRRARRRDTSNLDLVEDLWTSLWILLESSGLNEAQLFMAGFSEFITDVMLKYLKEDGTHQIHPNPPHNQRASLYLWLAALTLSSRMSSTDICTT